MNVIWNVSILDIERSYPLHVLHQEAPLLVFNDPPFNTPLSFSFLCKFIVETSFVVGWHLLEIYFNPELVISDQSGDRIKNIYKIEKKKLKKTPYKTRKRKLFSLISWSSSIKQSFQIRLSLGIFEEFGWHGGRGSSVVINWTSSLTWSHIR